MRRLLLAAALTLTSLLTGAAEPVWQTLDYAPAPADNPLKGLVPYAGAANPDAFPHIMEFSYFPLSAFVTAPDTYDWRTLDRFLDAVAARGHQAIFRVYSEYPGKTSSLPAFLLRDGLPIFRSQRASTPPRPPVDIETPDYNNAALRQTLVAFIKALGARYDGDPRIGFITAGLLGHWGEWHNHPLQDQFASKVVQAEVMDAYEAAFRRTPVLLRYPAGDDDARYAANATRPFGLHDDSFAWSTLPTRNSHFMALMQKAGATDKWQAYPIGGEIRPEAWGKVFDTAPGDPKIEDFAQCVAATHASWLMDSGMFRSANPPERRARAIAAVQRMGYEFHVARVALNISGRSLTVLLDIENRGVAPFHADWPIELALRDNPGRLIATVTAPPLTGILPGAPTRRQIELALPANSGGPLQVLLRVPNALPEAPPVRFANQTQDADLAGWLSLGVINIPASPANR
ncbi:DUF4832 domain-containing protein [Viridibacterium curvum]|uniref:DUF4832 domain-containing protein n=1 Tax=Viridibacterium curvum TaxID=1101404 RepID=A0ABP9R6F8_9RHOO